MQTEQLDEATRIVSDYGKFLATVEPGVYGMSDSLLPHPRPAIRAALRALIGHPDIQQNMQVMRGLIDGYVHLAQFVPYRDAASAATAQRLIAAGKATESDSTRGATETGLRVINQIKLEMEKALDEARQLLQAVPA